MTEETEQMKFLLNLRENVALFHKRYSELKNMNAIYQMLEMIDYHIKKECRHDYEQLESYYCSNCGARL